MVCELYIGTLVIGRNRISEMLWHRKVINISSTKNVLIKYLPNIAEINYFSSMAASLVHKLYCKASLSVVIVIITIVDDDV